MCHDCMLRTHPPYCNHLIFFHHQSFFYPAWSRCHSLLCFPIYQSIYLAIYIHIYIYKSIGPYRYLFVYRSSYRSIYTAIVHLQHHCLSNHHHHHHQHHHLRPQHHHHHHHTVIVIVIAIGICVENQICTTLRFPHIYTYICT